MATISCPCCRVEISAESRACYVCAGRPPLQPGHMLVEYALTPDERRLLNPECPHRSHD